MTDPALPGQTVGLLQQLIRNQGVNDGSVGSGQEVRTSDVLRSYLAGSGLDLEVYDGDPELTGDPIGDGVGGPEPGRPVVPELPLEGLNLVPNRDQGIPDTCQTLADLVHAPTVARRR